MRFTTDQQRELLQFVSDCGKGNRRPLRDHLTAELFRQILSGEREIGDMCTNQGTGDVFVRFCFTEKARGVTG